MIAATDSSPDLKLENQPAAQTSGDAVSVGLSRWGTALDGGFVVVPNVLLAHSANLGLSATELAVLINVMSFQWGTSRKPYPRVATIARRMGITPRTVQRSLNHLRDRGLLGWERVQVRDGRVLRTSQPGQGVRRRIYDLAPLVERLAPLVAAHKEERGARQTRKGSHQIAA